MNGDPTKSIEDIVRRNVATLRSKANLTQQGLADEMLLRGIPWTRETVAQVETTNRRLGFTEAVAVAACLDVPVARLTATGAVTVTVGESEWSAAYLGAALAGTAGDIFPPESYAVPAPRPTAYREGSGTPPAPTPAPLAPDAPPPPAPGQAPVPLAAPTGPTPPGAVGAPSGPTPPGAGAPAVPPSGPPAAAVSGLTSVPTGDDAAGRRRAPTERRSVEPVAAERTGRRADDPRPVQQESEPAVVAAPEPAPASAPPVAPQKTAERIERRMRLRVTASDVDATAQHLWSRSLESERERRVTDRHALTGGSLKTIRGHVSRDLDREIAHEMERNPERIDNTAVDTAEMSPDEAAWEATRLNIILANKGYSDSDVTRWWNFTRHRELDDLTIAEAWKAGSFDAVSRLIESLPDKNGPGGGYYLDD